MGLSLKVAVIGAGFAGLVAARELKREGHRVVVFEKANQVGGTWLYDPKVESDQLSLDPNRKIVHNSLYFSLRTNLPRQAMGFSDYPFRVREDGDPRTFPGHEEVQRFLNDFANDFGIVELIRFGNDVVRVERVDSEGEMWLIESKIGELELVTELFEAVVVCNGHCTVPIVAHIPGIEKWPGKQVHSHNYRHPAPFQNQKNKHVESGQVVVIIGSGPSAIDISSEIAKVAKEVHLSSRSPAIISVSKVENYPNIWQHAKITKTYEDGMIEFEDSSSVLANTVLHCTGYTYGFPFLKTNGALSIKDKRVGPLYKHIFPPSLAPRLSFIGIPIQGIISFVTELQSKWVASVLSGKLHLPCEEKMLADVEQHYQYMQEFGIPKHHTHLLGFKEFGYQNWLAAEIGVPQVDKRVTSLYKNTVEFFISQKEVLRDNFDLEKFST